MKYPTVWKLFHDFIWFHVTGIIYSENITRATIYNSLNEYLTGNSVTEILLIVKINHFEEKHSKMEMKFTS